MPTEPRQPPSAPVHITALDEERKETPQEGIALCLSGGGYRAMLFHVGALWRLNDVGYLPKLNRVSSVSGGSITAGVLALSWGALAFDGNGVGQMFQKAVVDPIRYLASVTIDQWAIGFGVLTPGASISDRVAASYRKYLFGSKTLQDLADEGKGTPRFVFNATNVQSGCLWRFSKPYMADWRVGRVLKPRTELAVAVAASSAFPPVLSPAHLSLEPGACVKNPGSEKEGNDLNAAPYATEVILTDGGVYDNLGLETAWKNYTTVLVSDGGGKTAPDPHPPADWARHAKRVLDVIDNQVRSLRKRQLIDSYQLPAEHQYHREGTYWGVRTDIADYGLPTALPCPHTRSMELANIPTRLKALPDDLQERLINWGYAVCDAAMRRHVIQATPSNPAWPYGRQPPV